MISRSYPRILGNKSILININRVDLATSIEARLKESESSTKLVEISQNLVDKTRDTPPRSLGPILPYPLKLSGESTASKLTRVRALVSDRLTSSFGPNSKVKTTEWIYLLPTLPAIAWLLNYRCPSDVPFCPVAYAYLALTPTRCVIFVDERKIGDPLAEIWKEDGIEARPYGVEEVGKFIKETVGELSLREEKRTVKIWGSRECSWALGQAVSPVSLFLPLFFSLLRF